MKSNNTINHESQENEHANRMTAGNMQQEDIAQVALRPHLLSEFIGQDSIKENLKVFIKAAQSRGDVLDHILFYGPPGLGKTTLANAIAREMSSGFKITSGPMLTKPGDVAAILTSLQPHDVLFIDEIHRLSAAIEEILYSAMEDFAIDVIIGEGPGARTLRIALPKFTLIGATTRLGLLSNPLRDRFGIPLKLEFYSIEALTDVIKRGSRLLGFDIDHQSATIIARCSRGTPRIAIRLLKRVRDFSTVANKNTIAIEDVNIALSSFKVDEIGLDSLDFQYLRFISENCGGGPVGIETIAAALSEDKDTIEDTIEPYLIQIGFIMKTPRGRVLSKIALDHLHKAQMAL